MRVLITGVAGFIGSHIADALLEAGHEVAGVDDLSTGRHQIVAAGVDFMMWTSCSTRAVNSASGMKRATSMARYIWLTRTVLPRKRMPPTSLHMAPPLSTEHKISTIMARPLPL